MAVAALIATALAILVYFIYHKIKTTHTYWLNKGIKGPTPRRLLGNVKTLWTREESINILTDRICNEYPNEKVVGIYQGLTPTLIIRDPDIMKQVLVKDFASFTDRGIRVSNEPVTKTLFGVDGDDWKTLRQKLTPLFTTGKLKQMVPLMNACVESYMEYLDRKTKESSVHEVRRLNMQYTMKAITSVAFGIDVDTFVEEPTQFEVMANQLFTPTGIRRYAVIINNVWPGIMDKLHIRVSSKEIVDFFLQLVKELVHLREGKPKVRKDFMDLMIELREQGKLTRLQDGRMTELEVTYELITAQAIVFYAAGFETSSGSMSFLLHELALNPEIQKRCHEEVDRVMEKHNGKLDYDALKELQYVSMAFDESLRKHPVAPVLFRQCVSDYKFEDLDLTINKGTKILIPVISIQRDPKYFADPEKFDPDRFSPENKDSIHEYYLPFGDGPRNCIGMRLAKVQSMLGMAHFLYNFKVSPCEKTVKKIAIDPNALTLVSKDGIWLNVERRTRTAKGYQA